MERLKIVAELRQRRALIEEAIVVLERLAPGYKRQRGRPPDWKAAYLVKRPGRPPGSKNKPKEPAIE
jgi:hypothetical protein